MIHYSHITVALKNADFSAAQAYIEMFLSDFDPNHMMIETVSSSDFNVHAFIRDDENAIMAYQAFKQHVITNDHHISVEPVSLGNVIASVLAMRNCNEERFIMYELDEVC